MEPSDEALCRRVAERDERAFDLLVERHQERAYRLAWSILGDGEEAKDLSQEAFLRVFEKASSFDGRSKFSTWFHRILVNLCLDHRRKRRSWLERIFVSEDSGEPLELVDRQPSPVGDPAADAAHREAMTRVWQAASGLSGQQRAALSLQVREDLSTSEIAAVLECSEATVRVHLHRALATLRKAVGGTG